MILRSDDSAEMAKLYGNKSAACYQLALQAEIEESDSDDKVEILQHALDDGLKSVELDSSYEKGHFRLILSTFLLVVIRVRTDLGVDFEPHPVQCRLNWCQSIFVDRI